MTGEATRAGTAGSPVRSIVILWAVWAATVLIAAAVIQRLPPPPADGWNGAVRAPPLARWDSGWYLTIADFGFRFDPGLKQNNVTFYPLFPVVVGALSRCLRTPLFWTGIVFNLLCLLPALLVYADLAEQWGGAGSARAAARSLLLWPTAFYFAAFYTEALFLLTTVVAFWASRRRRWGVAGVSGFLAALTRLNGFLIILPIGWYVWRLMAPGRRWKASAGLAGPILGAVVFPVYLWLRWHDPLLAVRSKTMGWNQHLSPVWTLVSNASMMVTLCWQHVARVESLVVLLQIISILLFVALTVALFRMRLKAEGLYCGATMLLLLHSGTIDGIDRYVVILFPAFFVLGMFLRARPWLASIAAVLGSAYGLLLLYGFVRWTAVS